MSQKKNVMEVFTNACIKSEVNIGEIATSMNLSAFDPNTTVEELVLGWVESYANSNDQLNSDYTVGGAINKLAKYKDMNEPILSSIWGVNDVQGIADEFDTKLTDDEIKQVFADVDSNHDCEIGITWESIRFAVSEVVSARIGK